MEQVLILTYDKQALAYIESIGNPNLNRQCLLQPLERRLKWPFEA
jgi:hypothetical protein